MLVAPAEIQPIDVTAFEAVNAQSWVANADFWADAGAQTPLRDAMLSDVDGVIAAELASTGTEAHLIDLGCGDGGFLARLNAADFSGTLSGIDQCAALVARARSTCPPARIDVADLTDPAFHRPDQATIATCLLTLVEIARFERALACAARVLRPGGLFIATVLDPTIETLRFLEFKRGKQGTTLYDVAGEIAIGSLFNVQDALSPAPYFRFFRPIDRYVAAMHDAGLRLERLSSAQCETFPFQAEPRAVMMCGRKPPVGGAHAQ